ncbi:MAG: hypothetical protein AAGF12_33870 [Myxococcota bacterium]
MLLRLNSAGPLRAELRWLLFAPAAVLGLVMSCGGGDFRQSRNGSVYRDAEARYRVGNPGSGWSRLSVEDENDLAWHHQGLSAVIQVNASCDGRLDIPLRALTGQLLIGFTDREVRTEELVPFDRREALRTHLTARLDGVARELVFHILKKDGCVYDLSLVAPPDERFAQAEASYQAVLAGFGTTAP